MTLTPERVLGGVWKLAQRLRRRAIDQQPIGHDELDALEQALLEAKQLVVDYGSEQYDKGKHEPRLF